MVDAILVVGAQTCCALLQIVNDLKATHMNGQHSLIRGLILSESEPSKKATAQKKKKKSCAKSQSAVDQRTVFKWFKKFNSSSKKYDDKAWLGRHETVDSEAALQSDFTTLAKASGTAELALTFPKYCITSDLP